MAKKTRRARARHILPVPAQTASLSAPQALPRIDTVAEANYLDGLRNDNFLDGLIGGNDMNGHTGGGWSNRATGLGTFNRDKVMQGHYNEPFRIDDPQLSAMYNGNDLAKRIIDTKPREMFRRGWVLVIPAEDEPEEASDSPQDAATREEDTEGQGADEQPRSGESGAASPGAPLVDPMGAPPDNASGKPPSSGGPGDKATKQTGAGPDNATAKKPTTAPPAEGASVGGLDDTKSGARPNTGVGQGADRTATKPTDNPHAVDTPKGKNEGKQNDTADLAKKVEAYATRIGVIPRFLEACIFGRLYGGGLLVVGADDGQDMATPLQEDAIKTVRYLSWIDRRFIFAATWYTEIGPKYGEVETWEIVNPFGGQSNTRVHETRVIRFDGAPVDFLMRRRLMGWTLSMLQTPYDTLRQFDMSFQSVSNLMVDMSQAVMKINGLAQLISNDPITLQTRMQMVDASRSSARMIYLDAENEEFKREPTPMTGVADTIEMFMLRMAAAAEMPVAILFGREPSGLNATGDADFRRFYDTIAGAQKQELEPKLRRMYTLICSAKDSPCKGRVPQYGVEFVWHKLYEPSEKEQAEIRWLMAQADDKYIANKTLLPEEVALSRFRSGDLHLDTEIEMEMRNESLETAELAPTGAAAAQQEHEQQLAQISTKQVPGQPGKPGKPGAPKPGAPKPAPFGAK